MQLATLGIIPPAMVPAVDEPVELVGGRLADQAGRVVDVATEPFDVGEVDELLGPEGLGDRPGDGVGVDVVRLTGLVGADRGDDRDELVVDEAVEHLGVDRVTSPTKPSSGSRATARMSPPSTPLTPTA
jgi:hypothetical protein